MRTEGIVSAGYVIVRRAARPADVDSSLLPGELVSVSDSLAPVLPSVPPGWLEALDTPPGRFSGYADAAQGNLLWALEADLARFGLDGTRSASVCDWLGAAWAHGDFHPPSAFATPDAARRFARAFGPPPGDALLVGLGVREEDVDAVADADDSGTFVSRLTVCREPVADGGTVLGFDVYRVEDGELLTWVREQGADASLAAAGLRPNGHGLFASEDDAARAAVQLAQDGGHWFALQLTEYPLRAA